jgi:CBS domain-containing protein
MINQEPPSIATNAAPRRTSAADVMNSAPRTCSRFSRVIEVVLIFKEEDCGMVPVVEEGRPIGVVTDRDVALALGRYDNLVDRPVSDIMTTNPVSVAPDAPLAEVVELFAREAVRRLLVVDAGGRLVGVIGWKDVCGELPNRVVGRVVASIVEDPSRK